MKICQQILLVTRKSCVDVMAESCELIILHLLFLSWSNLLEKLSWDSTVIRIHVVIMFTATMSKWMLSSGSIGVTQLSVSATGMSFPFLYTTLKGRYGNDLTISLYSRANVNHVFLVDTYKWLVIFFQCQFLTI